MVELERTGRAREEGARDTAHLLQMRYGLSGWKARRMVEAAGALERLPRLGEALEQGVLGPDKAIELARYATPGTEEGLIRWAARVSYAAVRRRGELEEQRGREQEERLLRERSCTWYLYDAGRRFHLDLDLPAADGVRLATAVEEVAGRIPVLPGEEDPGSAPARRADAILALCTGWAGEGEGPSVSATVVLHAQVGPVGRGAELEAGGVADPGAASRLACTGTLEHLHEDPSGRVLHRRREPRRPPVWMVRQVRYRDGGCTFPGCGTRAFCEAHHIVFHRFGGPTTLENLTLLCSFHHRLVHEHGWRIRRTPEGGLVWLRPDGRVHTPEPVLRGSDVDPVQEPVVYGPFGEGDDASALATRPPSAATSPLAPVLRLGAGGTLAGDARWAEARAGRDP
ncbi:hypothetical protein HRbin12_01392 [bacterium HR12]|nr:hypothetical protein HRbin12_01392 [bacterium HR12]